MPRLQELIHALELGAGARYLRLAALLLGIVTVAVVYDLREFQNLRSEAAMDTAQLARNIAEGRGFTTRYIRPLSMRTLMQYREDRDPLIKEEHPDLANAPLYPLVLAGFMSIPGLFVYDIEPESAGLFRRYQPDFVITLINQGLFFVAVALTWRLARRLFEPRVAWLTVLVMLGTDLLWQFSASGHYTMLALVLITALANVLCELDHGASREPPRGPAAMLGLAVMAGLLCGLLGMTRYSLAVLAVPTLVYLAAGFPGRRLPLTLAAGLVFLAVFTPWLVRNWQICGNPFGIAAYNLIKETPNFTDNWLERSLDPELPNVGRDDIVRKAFVGAGRLFREDLPELGGSWVTAFFLVGLLVPFVQASRSRLRWFTVGALVMLSLAQILGRTHLSNEVERVNAENLLVLVSPLVFMFGVALIVLLVYSLELPAEAWRNVVFGGVIAVFWMPLLITFGPPRVYPLAFPPYYPPHIQQVARYFDPGELIMADMPWAVAWYGNRQSVLMTKNPDKEFLDLTDWQKTVHGLFLTRITLDERFLSGWVLNARDWGRFVIQMLTRGEVPTGFPLRKSPAVLSTFPFYLLLADREDRWTNSIPIRPPSDPTLEKPEPETEQASATTRP
jgi:hypothetical protein